MAEHRVTHIPFDDQQAAFDKGYVWQGKPHRRLRDHTNHGYAKSIMVFLDKGLLAFSADSPETTGGALPAFTGDAWWDK